MTLEQYLYINLFATEFRKYAYNLMVKRKYIIDKDKFSSQINLALLYILTEMILFYYRETVDSDENLFTEAEIKEIINIYNDISDADIAYQEF